MLTEFCTRYQFVRIAHHRMPKNTFKKPLKLAVLGILVCAIRRKLIHSAIFCCHFLFISCLSKAASFVRIFKKILSGLCAGPFDSIFDVMEKWHEKYLPLMVYADLDTYGILLKFGMCLIWTAIQWRKAKKIINLNCLKLVLKNFALYIQI